MDRDKPVARILPIAEEPGAHNESVAARAIRMGFAAPAKRPRGGLPPLRRDDAPLSLVDSLLAEREEARY